MHSCHVLWTLDIFVAIDRINCFCFWFCSCCLISYQFDWTGTFQLNIVTCFGRLMSYIVGMIYLLFFLLQIRFLLWHLSHSHDDNGRSISETRDSLKIPHCCCCHGLCLEKDTTSKLIIIHIYRYFKWSNELTQFNTMYV